MRTHRSAGFVMLLAWLAGCGAHVADGPLQTSSADATAAQSGGARDSGALAGRGGADASALSGRAARAGQAGARSSEPVAGSSSAAGARSTQPAAGVGAIADERDNSASGAGAAGSAGARATQPVAGSGAIAGMAGVMSPNSMMSAGSKAEASDYHPCPSDGRACKIMPFGDSITDGYNQDTPGGYRVELFRLAHSAGKNMTFVGSGSNGPDKVDGVDFPHNHEGHSGWTIAPAGGRSGISTLVATVMPKHAPDVVLLMIGTNDAIDNYEMAKAPARLGQLIDAIYAELPNVLIVVASLIPARGDRGQGDDAEVNARIETFNASVPALIKLRADAGKHIALVDMHKPFEADARSLLEEQWHPNLKGYVRLGAEWFKALQPLL